MIEIERLTKIYGESRAVDDVTLTVETGTVAAIVGTSGSGKTTLLRMVNRLVEPSSGTVRINGDDARAIAPHLLRRRIGYVIQGNGLFPHHSVARNVEAVPRLLGWDRARRRERVDELLSLLQLDPAEFRDRFPHELSGGQQQRVGIARALAARPDLLLMDEPFGALDPIIRAKAQDDLRAIQRALGATVMIVTHDMEEAIRLADRVAVMDGGQLLQYAAPAEIVGRPATPFVAALVGDADRPMKLLSLIPLGDVVEPGEAPGPPLEADASLRDALAAGLWSGRRAIPVTRAGRPLGRVTLDAILARGARPP